MFGENTSCHFECVLENTKQESLHVTHLVLLRLSVAAELLVAHHLHARNAHLHGLQHVVGLSIHKDLLLLEGRVLGDEVKTALSLLLLELQGDATHRTSLDSLHQVLRVTTSSIRHTVT